MQRKSSDKEPLLPRSQQDLPVRSTKRRPTFSGPLKPNYSLPHSHENTPMQTTATTSPEYEVADALGNLESCANSINEDVTPVRDLRTYDPRNLPNAKSSRLKAVNLHPSSPKSGRRASYNTFGSGFNTHSPSFAEKWVKRQQSEWSNYGATSASATGAATPPELDLFQRRSSGDNGAAEDSDFDSKPSSRRSSESSSLADVCFPLEQLESNGPNKVWPDLQVLQEFYEHETEQLKDDALKDINEMNFKFDKNNVESNDDTNGVGFSHPIITKVDTPKLLGNQRINETETLNGRLRPPKINPWDKKQKIVNNEEFLRTINYPPQIVNNNPEHFRFTYFRENLSSTIHSPTISGLLQPGQTFKDLFQPLEYSRAEQDQADQQQSQQQQQSQTQQPQQQPLTLQSQAAGSSTRENTPIDLNQDLNDEHISPFWLDVLNPTEEEMKVLSKAFAIHPLTTEDIFLGETREKVELFRDYYFICFRSFDIVHEKAKRLGKLNDQNASKDRSSSSENGGFFSKMFGGLAGRRRQSSSASKQQYSSSILDGDNVSQSSSVKRRMHEIELAKYKKKSGDRHKPRVGELEPLNVYILVFRNAVLTFHFAPTPHPVNVRRRARLLREYLTVSADWIAYALIDDITDAFGPMIESIEDEVNSIEDAILRMHPGNDYYDDDDSSSSDESDDEYARDHINLNRRGSNFDDKRSMNSISSSHSTRSTSSNVIEWKRKGDMLKRIGESRKRVMSLLRLLGSKADVIKGFAKRCNEQWEVAPRSEIGMYLGDIQDHIVTMVQSLNHYEKLLARSHSNYLAQINIDMTRVNNDMNDVLGKISILGTVVLPMNIVTGLWGMNVLVPGQEADGLVWFWCIAAGMFVFAFGCYTYAKRISGLA